MTRLVVVLVAAACVFASGSLAWAFNCPVVMKQAGDLIRKAESGKTSAETKPLIDEAKKLLGEAKAHHENAKTKRDHAEAVRKAKFASALAEEAIVLQSP
jgi:hypothetical protein